MIFLKAFLSNFGQFIIHLKKSKIVETEEKLILNFRKMKPIIH